MQTNRTTASGSRLRESRLGTFQGTPVRPGAAGEKDAAAVGSTAAAEGYGLTALLAPGPGGRGPGAALLLTLARLRCGAAGARGGRRGQRLEGRVGLGLLVVLRVAA